MCVFVALGLVLPRVALAVLWLLGQTAGVYSPWWLGVLGFVAMPYTTLGYLTVHHYSGGVTSSGPHLLLLAIFVLMDASTWKWSHSTQRSRRS